MGTFRNFVSSSVLGGTLYRIHRCSITIVTNIIPSKILALGKCPGINRQCMAQTSVNSARVFTSQSCVASFHKYSALKRRSIHLFHFSSCRKSNLLLNDWFMMTLPVLRGTLASRMASSRSKVGDSYYRRTALIYVCAVGIFMLGMSYAGVPLYRMLCQATGLGGTVVRGHDSSKIETMQKVPDRIIRVRFNADVASSMRWNFKPQQTEVKVLPGETALAFYTAKNSTDKPIIGISTYNVVPFEAGQYFNKIQCFCFEEQRLNPHEQVDMPVFFYIDPEFVEDPKLKNVDTITLSYTFFQAKEGLQLPLPGYMTQ